MKPLATFFLTFILCVMIRPVLAESVTFASSWSTYVGSPDPIAVDVVTDVALDAEGRITFGGWLGGGYFSDGESGEVIPVHGPFYQSDNFIASIPASGGADVFPQYTTVNGQDGNSPGSERIHIAVSSQSVVGVGTYQEDSESTSWGEVVHYDRSLEENWYFLLSGGEESAFLAVALDKEENVYAAGFDCSTNGLMPGAIVYKFTQGGEVVWSNYLGGARIARVTACVASRDGVSLYVAGTSTNKTGATVSFLRSLNAGTGAVLAETTFAGGATCLAVDSAGGILVGGTAAGGFLKKFVDSGTSFSPQWERSFPGSGTLNALALDASNRVAVAGTSSSAWFDAGDGTVFAGETAGYAVILSPDARETLFASWLGGEAETTATGIAFRGDVLSVCGATCATNWILGGFCETNFKEMEKWDEDDDLPPYGYLKTWLGPTFIPNPPGTLTVSLFPEGVVDAGAGWSVDGGRTWLADGAYTNLTEGVYNVTFRDAEEYTAPAPRSGIVISPAVTNVLIAEYIPVPPPFAKRKIVGTNITLTVVLPPNLDEANLLETLDSQLTPAEFENGMWSPKNSRLTLDCSPVGISGGGEKIVIQYTVSGVPGTYAVSGRVRGFLEGETVTNAPVSGDEIVIIPEPGEPAVIPPPPDITELIREDGGWTLTFISTQRVDYVIQTNASLIVPFTDYAVITNVHGNDGRTTVRLAPREKALFFRVKSAAQP